MNIKKSLIAAVVLMGLSAATFAQEPAKPAKKGKAKTEKPASDTAKVHHKHAKPAKKGA